jgi:dTDP-4-amino-4,6-dideoxygalactose transaminase
VPFVDLTVQHRAIADRIGPELERVMATGAFTDGPDVAAFEEAFASYCGAGHAIGVASGTDALEIALRASGVSTGDEVIVPANSFVATAEAVVRAGAVPVFVDVDQASLLIDPACIEAAIGPRTRAVVPVHLYGQLAPMSDIADLARRHGLVVVADAAQAQGATANGSGIGAGVTAAATSFYPTKNLGAYGDGGAVLTDDPAIAARARSIGHHGVEHDRSVHVRVGFTSRLDTMQAVVLRAKLDHLDVWNRERAEAAARYDELLLDGPGPRRAQTVAGNVHVFHLYVVRVAERDRVLAALTARGIGAGVHYAGALHRQLAFAPWDTRASCPVTDDAVATVLSLPMFPGITADQQARVV